MKKQTRSFSYNYTNNINIIILKHNNILFCEVCTLMKQNFKRKTASYIYIYIYILTILQYSSYLVYVGSL